MARKVRKTAGVIGLGIIGSRAAAGLRAAGWQVFVWNRSPQPAPNFLGSAAEVAEVCEVIQVFVADGQALFDVIERFGDRLTPDHIIVCSATVGLEATRQAAKLVTAKGARFLDAPFTGSKVAAEKRELVYYVGGDEGTFLRARPMLEATSRAIVRVGEIGDAAIVKVVTNMIAAVSIQTLAEALAIVSKAGLEPDVLAAALEQNACRSGTMELKLPKMMSGDYEPHFSLKHMFKDVQLGIQLANTLDVEIPATTVTAGVLYGAQNHGWGELDFSAIFKVYEAQLAKQKRAALEDSTPERAPEPVETPSAAPAPPRDFSGSAMPSQSVIILPPTVEEPLVAPSAEPEATPPPSTPAAPLLSVTASPAPIPTPASPAERLEVVARVPRGARPTADLPVPGSTSDPSSDAPRPELGGEPHAKPFNRIKRFFSGSGQ